MLWEREPCRIRCLEVNLNWVTFGNCFWGCFPPTYNHFYKLVNQESSCRNVWMFPCGRSPRQCHSLGTFWRWLVGEDLWNCLHRMKLDKALSIFLMPHRGVRLERELSENREVWGCHCRIGTTMCSLSKDPRLECKLEITQHPHLDGTDYYSVYTGYKVKMRPSEIQSVWMGA